MQQRPAREHLGVLRIELFGGDERSLGRVEVERMQTEARIGGEVRGVMPTAHQVVGVALHGVVVTTELEGGTRQLLPRVRQVRFCIRPGPRGGAEAPPLAARGQHLAQHPQQAVVGRMLRQTDLEQRDGLVGVAVPEGEFGEACGRVDRRRVDLQRFGPGMGRPGIVAPLGLEVADPGPGSHEPGLEFEHLPEHRQRPVRLPGVRPALRQVEPDPRVGGGELGRPLQQG